MNTSIETDGGFLRLSGTEADVARLLARRQELGIRKYQTTVRENPLTLRQWLVHQQEELADALIYATRAIEELDKQALAKAPEAEYKPLMPDPKVGTPIRPGEMAYVMRELEDEFRARRTANMWRPYDQQDDGK